MWVSEQQAAENEKREKEQQKQLALEQELIAKGEVHPKYKSVAFMYEPPASYVRMKEKERLESHTAVSSSQQLSDDLKQLLPHDANGANGANGGLDNVPGADVVGAVAADPSATVETEFDAAEEKKKPEKKSQKEVMEERFPLLKGAPTAGEYTKDMIIRHKPFGVQIQNVKCLRCGQWGHRSGDRECPLIDENPLDVSRKLLEDPMSTLRAEQQQQQQQHQDKFILKYKTGSTLYR